MGLDERLIGAAGMPFAGIDDDVARRDHAIGADGDDRPVEEGVAVAPGECERGVGKGRGELRCGGLEGAEVVRIEVDFEAMRDDRADSIADPTFLHRPLEPALDLDGTDGRPEQPRRLALEEPFEKTLDGGKGSHVGGGV